MTAEFTLRLIGMMLFALLGALLGVDFSDALLLPPEATGLTFSLMGALAGLIITPWITTYPARTVRRTIIQTPPERLFIALLGLALGIVVAAFLAWPLSLLPDPFGQFIPSVGVLLVVYVFMMVFTFRSKDLQRLLGVQLERDKGSSTPGTFPAAGGILLDTSVIIDGRIRDISQTGFIQTTMLVPRFVLTELQHVADSADLLRRNRGKRGLEILGELQQVSKAPVEIIDDDVDSTDEVDSKLVILAQERGVPVMTNDFNLNRVAELQGVQVLNINELSNALKAIFLPGEVIDLYIVMEGREENQGVGYLEDGTMVVVEEGKRYMDRTIPVLITRYIVTNAGRMYFAQPEGSLRK